MAGIYYTTGSNGEFIQHMFVENINSGTNPIASDGSILQIDSLTQTFSYNVDSTLNYIQVTSGGSDYRQTYTYTNGKVSSISNWVKQ